jgi:hypothetical protein
MKYCRNCKYFGFFCNKPECYYKEPFEVKTTLKFIGVKKFTKYKYFSLIENAEGNCPYYKRKWWKFWINP